MSGSQSGHEIKCSVWSERHFRASTGPKGLSREARAGGVNGSLLPLNDSLLPAPPQTLRITRRDSPPAPAPSESPVTMATAKLPAVPGEEENSILMAREELEALRTAFEPGDIPQAASCLQKLLASSESTRLEVGVTGESGEASRPSLTPSAAWALRTPARPSLAS
eukprot:bmy_15973T0